MRRAGLLIVFGLLGLFLAGGRLQAERPAAPLLLPSQTLLMVRVTDAQVLRSRFAQTALGRMAADEQLRPLLLHLYGSAAEAFEQVEKEIGLSLTELLALPQGEVCLAMIKSDGGRPAPLLLVELGDQLPAAEKLLERGRELLAQQGVDRETEKAGDTTLNIYSNVGPRGRTLVQFLRDGVLVITPDRESARELLARWDGDGDDEVLANKDHYKTLMSRCQGAKEERPQATFYVDPIGLASAGGGLGAGAAFIPVLGLDGLLGVGGGLSMPEEDFDTVFHLHVLLDNPRAGVLELAALGAGPMEPEPWTPADARSYLTLHWKVDETYEALERLYDSILGDDALAGEIDRRLSQPLSVDVKKEVIDALEGRLIHVSWLEPPYRLNSAANLVAVQLNDAKAFRPVLEKLMENVPQDRVENRTFSGVDYYHIELPQPGRRRRAEREREENAGDAPERVRLEMRRPVGCVCILGDYLLWCDSEKLLEVAITSKSDPQRSLAQELDFKVILAKIKRQPGGAVPGMIWFNRPEKSMRLWYELAQAANTRTVLQQGSENNGFFRALDSALQDHPLPPFAVLEQYLAPTGSLLVNEETGIHYSGFSLKRKAP
ncbi:hypothetical protein [Lignipirellula cremea]|uniref:DUF3352 domain-containing protein n=1 Tax=Lignipirellula cremea TaxID=2528010 RepID=A0A518E214_9BACT|nr:hypothetical protein [Lignipirellula cremea]QDU98136.1 hypothetical protein Pla8534_59970 [Lignipirellula cremea]